MNNLSDKILYGGDYNPEQWDEATRLADMELLPKAGIDIVTLNVFSWTLIQPDENTYDFTELDRIVNMVTEKGMKICMATSTAAHPAWMAKKYPDILRVDEHGRKRKYGARHNSCPNSPTYRHYSPLLALQLAKHYADCRNIAVWHISNEYGGACYCENCEKAFREWLKDKYKTLDNLNYAWNSNFWSHKILDWDEIVAPSYLSECSEWGRSSQPAIVLDYMRFNSDGMLRNYIDERDAIRSVIPDAVITTNFMEMFKPLDYRKWAGEMDIVSWDSYPQKNTERAYVAFNHDIMRGLKQGQPFMLMEQSPTASSWLPVNTMKRPGEMRLLSYQAVAHGADTVMFFQMRKSPGACEMFHGAVINHSGREDTRTFCEVSALGAELGAIGDATLLSRINAEVAIIFDWNCWWALEEASGITHNLRYPEEALNYYRALYELNIPVDIISTSDSLDSYKLVIAPCLFMLRDDIESKLCSFAASGNTVILTTMSGIVTEDNRAILGGFPGKLMPLTGLWVEETCMLDDSDENSFSYNGTVYPAKLLCDILRLETSESLCRYASDYFAGTAAVAHNKYESGNVYYVGTTSVPDFYRSFIADVCNDSVITDVLMQSPDNDNYDPSTFLEMTRRTNDTGSTLFVLNHHDTDIVFSVNENVRDLLTGTEFSAGDEVFVSPKGALLLYKSII